MRVLISSLALLAACVSTPRPEVSEKLVAEGKAYYREGKYPQAIDSFTRAIQENLRNADAYVARGNAWVRIGDRSIKQIDETLKAIDDYTRAIEIFPMHHQAIFNRAMAHAAIGRFREAVGDLRALLEGSPLDVRRQAHLKLGLILVDKYDGREAEALFHFQQYLDLGGDDPAIRARVDEMKRSVKQEASDDSEKKAEALIEEARETALSDKPKALKALFEVVRQFPNTKAARETVPKLISAWTRAPQ